MHIIHFSAECYPAAKVGGLADVVGSLPKYLNQSGEQCEAVIPKYDNVWMGHHDFELVFEHAFSMNYERVLFTVQRLKDHDLGYPLYVIDIPGRFDRPGIYIDPWSGHGYWDEFERFLSFQIAALEWLKSRKKNPGVVHCHDHHTGLIPFMMTQCNRFRKLSNIPSVMTVHTAEYHGEYPIDNYKLMPAFHIDNIGLLDWDGKLNSLASGLKNAWKITTVSESYMEELAENSNGLELLFKQESDKSAGILNGIDAEVWDPQTDDLLDVNFSFKNRQKGKRANKEKLCQQFNLDPDLPLISFIGRLVREKGADLLPDLFKNFIYSEKEVNFVLLGTGDPQLHQIFSNMKSNHMGYFDATLEYNEKLAHQIYGGSDFILMPSRVEPCGLNQMFAMCYGTVPIVRAVGGLKDTVKDIDEDEGYGITFSEFSLQAASNALQRAVDLYYNKEQFHQIRKEIMKLDFSWKRSTQEYVKMYKSLKPE
ncbi:MAG: glycogen synthase [Balneolaceae bacterium]|nr:glycogen synthase [Balneolaceae bacterium]